MADTLPVSRKGIAFVLACLAFALACVVFALQFFVAERLPLLTEAELERAKKLWQEHGPTDYDIDVEIRGAQPGVVHAEIRHGAVLAQTRDNRVPPQWTWDTWSVPGLFGTLEQDMEIAENPEREIQAAKGTKWQLRCEFDPRYGYPRRYHRLVTGGPEVYWQVTSFVPK
jgi:hypothetical protein